MQKRSYWTVAALLLTLSGPLTSGATIDDGLTGSANFLNTKFSERNQPIIIQLAEDNKTPLDQPQYNFSFDKENFTLQFKFHPDTNNNKRRLFELMAFMNVLSISRLGTPLQLLEITSNARRGDLFAKHDLLALELDAKLRVLDSYQRNDFYNFEYMSSNLKNYKLSSEEAQLGIAELQSEIDTLQLKMKQILSEAKKNESQALKQREVRLRETKTLEILEAQEEKLNDLILKNDRKGVRQMIEAYLPFEVMSPVEIDYWKQWLDALEKPKEELSIVSFRGLDRINDKIQELEVNGKKRFGFMSTLLTKNQGSYTRRLRSLQTARKKNGNQDRQGVGADLLTSSGIVASARNHSNNPIGSPFLSTTPSINIALGFADDGVAAFKIDRRRLFVNLASGYAGEKEYLVPLIIFPDEVVAIKSWKSDPLPDIDKLKLEFREKVAKLIRAVGANGSKVDFQKLGLETLKPISDSLMINLCKEVFK